MDKLLTFKMTRADALANGLLVCRCGHRPNNHFDGGKCAFCNCDGYEDRSVAGKITSGGIRAKKAKRAKKA